MRLLHSTILIIVVKMASANMRTMKPLFERIGYIMKDDRITDDQKQKIVDTLKDRIDTLVEGNEITNEQKEVIVDKTSGVMLNQQLVDHFKMKDNDRDRVTLSKEDKSELSDWLDEEVTGGRISVDTANYIRAILDLGRSKFTPPETKTLKDGPVPADYEGNGKVTKLAWRDYDPTVNGDYLYNGIWGYAVGIREYALHTSHVGLNIFDVTDAADDDIFKVQTIPMSGGRIWRDVAVTEGHYAYVAAQGSFIIKDYDEFFSIDLSQLSGDSPHGIDENPITNDNIINHGYSGWGHTINAWKGLVFLNSANPSDGCKIFDVTQAPMNPEVVATYTGGDCHDSFAKEIYYQGEKRDLFFVADGYNQKFRIYDITDIRENNFSFDLIGETAYTSGYAHENCVSDDGKTLFVFEEFNYYDIAAYDISTTAKLQSPELISKFQYSLDGSADATVHNGFAMNNYLFVAYYAAGFRVFDISDVQNIVEVGKYDTYLDPDGDGNNENTPTSATDGAWNVYPYLPSGNVLVSDLVYGLFVFTVEPLAPTVSPYPTLALSVSPSAAPTRTATPTIECVTFEFEITTDFYPDETSWELVNADTEEIITSRDRDYHSGIGSNTYHKVTECIIPQCMIFILYDSYGDGQLGTYKATFNGRVLLECSSDCGKGSWSEKRSEHECFSPTAAPSISPTLYPSSSFAPTPDCEDFEFEIKLDNFPSENSWEVRSATDEILASRDSLYYEGIGRNKYDKATKCIPPQCMKLKVYDEFGDGIKASGYFKAFYKGVLVLESISGGWALLESEEFGCSITCRSRLNNKKDFKKFCKGRVNNKSKFPTFWKIDNKLSINELLDQKCEFETCYKRDCCIEGWKRKCSNTDKNGKNKPFKEKMCANGYTLHSNKKLKKKKCTGSGGKKCTSKDCCKMASDGN